MYCEAYPSPPKKKKTRKWHTLLASRASAAKSLPSFSSCLLLRFLFGSLLPLSLSHSLSLSLLLSSCPLFALSPNFRCKTKTENSCPHWYTIMPFSANKAENVIYPQNTWFRQPVCEDLHLSSWTTYVPGSMRFHADILLGWPASPW